jgi:hypothetical protein
MSDLAFVQQRINAAATRQQLDELLRIVWTDLWPRELSDADAQFLAEAIQARKPESKLDPAKPVAKLNGRVVSRFTPRPCRKRLTDEERVKRRHRKRVLGSSSMMPDTMRHHFTEGERAALFVISSEIKREGYCALSVDEIGDRAGVRRTTVQNALHQARLLGLLNITERPQRGAKNLTNIIRITSSEWLTWIKRGPSASRVIGSRFSKIVSPLETQDQRKKVAWQCSVGTDRAPDPSPGGGSKAFWAPTKS